MTTPPPLVLPALKRLRRILMSVLGILYIALVVIVFNIFGGSIDLDAVLAIIGMVTVMWILQWVTLLGDPGPRKPSPILAVLLLAFAFGSLDALLVFGWNGFSMTVLTEMSHREIGDYIVFFLLIGFVFGAVMVLFTGLRMGRYEFMRLQLLLHFFACLSMVHFLFWNPSDYRNGPSFSSTEFEVIGAVALVGAGLVLWWGIAPLAYLIAYRNYRSLPEPLDAAGGRSSDALGNQ
jgi:hypothetical protein